LDTTGNEQRVGTDHECVGPLLYDGRKGRIDVAIGGGSEDLDLPRDSGSNRLRVFGHDLGIRSFRIDEDGKASSCRQQFVQEPRNYAMRKT